MGKKNPIRSIQPKSFPFRKMTLFFLLYFSISLGLLMMITPFLSVAKVTLVRVITGAILGDKTPYIHNIPYFKSISISLPVFTGLYLAYRKVNPILPTSSSHHHVTALLCVAFLWLLEVGSHVLEIIVTKLSISSFLPNYSLTLLLSVGSIGFPILLWLILFHPSFLD
jgi:hypothetical protein